MLTRARSRRATIGTMLAVPSRLGYPVLFALIFGESAGLPLPGETALLTAGVLAGTGRLSLPFVIAVAIVAAVAGDTLGYWLGRRGGRPVLAHRGPFAAFRRLALERGERFFERHGAKTVFLGRFVPGVRVGVAVLAGAGGMPWPRFAIYNLTGAFVWASTVASLASLVGPAVAAAMWVTALSAAVIAGLMALVRSRRATSGAGRRRHVPGLS
jgi:membrane protein DedA with SNARE-associated domain